TIPWQAAAETKTGSGAADLSLPANGKAAQARHGKRQRLSGLRINTRSEIMINSAVRAHFMSIRKRIALGARSGAVGTVRRVQKNPCWPGDPPGRHRLLAVSGAAPADRRR